MRTNAKNFVKLWGKGQICGQNSKFWRFWRLYSHISAQINVKFGTGAVPPCQMSRLSEQCVVAAGRKAHFGPLHKRNTGMAALRAGLPVINVSRSADVIHRPMNEKLYSCWTLDFRNYLWRQQTRSKCEIVDPRCKWTWTKTLHPRRHLLENV